MDEQKPKPLRKVVITIQDIIDEETGKPGADITIDPDPKEIVRDLMSSEPTPALDYALAAINRIRERNKELNNVKTPVALQLVETKKEETT